MTDEIKAKYVAAVREQIDVHKRYLTLLEDKRENRVKDERYKISAEANVLDSVYFSNIAATITMVRIHIENLELKLIELGEKV
jgi:hypothetical protein